MIITHIYNIYNNLVNYLKNIILFKLRNTNLFNILKLNKYYIL